MSVLTARFVFGIDMKAVKTPSMSPELPVGCLIFIKPTDYEDIMVGDDITYCCGNKDTFVTHRVIEKNDETMQITTQGIANNVSDSPVQFENVLGKVVWHMDYIGYAVVWLSVNSNKIIVITIIITLFTLSLLADKIKELKKSAND